MTGPIDSELDRTMADAQIPVGEQTRPKHPNRPSPRGCAAYANRRPGWLCLLGSAVLADLELATSTIWLPARASLFTQGEDAPFLYLTCSGFLTLIAGRPEDCHMIVHVAGPGSMLGRYAVLSRGVYEVTAESLTPAQLRPVERERFLTFLHTIKRTSWARCSVPPGVSFCIAGCLSHRARRDRVRTACRLLIELAHKIGEHTENGEYRSPLLLTHEQMASMTDSTREIVTRTLGLFRQDGWVSIEESIVRPTQSRAITGGRILAVCGTDSAR
ncbi:MAG: Crp/Fnr family transcriptional regulator [Terracidiphilus sp.]